MAKMGFSLSSRRSLIRPVRALAAILRGGAWHFWHARYKGRSSASRSTVVRTTRARRGCPQRGPSTLRHSVRALSCYRSPASPAEQGLDGSDACVLRQRHRPSSRATRSWRRFMSRALWAPARASSTSAWPCCFARPRPERIPACDSACESRCAVGVQVMQRLVFG